MRPILFTIGGNPVYSYGVMLGLSCVLGAHLAVYLGERSGIERRKVWNFAFMIIVIGIVGARLHELIVTGKFTAEHVFKLQHSGRTAYGGFLSATLGAIGAAWFLKIPFWRVADAVAPTIALGLGLTRIGCFLYGCDYGLQSERFGVCFPRASPAFWDQHEAGLIPFGAQASLPVFPTQLLSSLAGFLIFVGLGLYWFRRPRREGSVFLLFFFSYGLARAGLEQLRGDLGRGTLGTLSTSAAIGLGTALAAAILLSPPLARFRAEAGPVLDLAEGEQSEETASDPKADPQAEAKA